MGEIFQIYIKLKLLCYIIPGDSITLNGLSFSGYFLYCRLLYTYMCNEAINMYMPGGCNPSAVYMGLLLTNY